MFTYSQIYLVSLFLSPYIIVYVDPSPPSSVRIKETKKDSVTIEIIKGEGRVKRFVVSVNGRDINVPASLNKDVTIYTISGLDSATKYPIKVSAVSNGAYNTELASIQMSLTTSKFDRNLTWCNVLLYYLFIYVSVLSIFTFLCTLYLSRIVIILWNCHMRIRFG